MRGGEDNKQEEGQGKRQVPSTMERIHSRREHLGKQGKPVEYRRFIKGVRGRIQQGE